MEKKLLILTQKIDSSDPILGFFHRWIEGFAARTAVIAVCLEEGENHLPQNVRVLSLGKESRRSRLQYIFRFYKYIWGERKNYDAVFVHMNQEYVILGGILWRFLGKKVYMWRNHARGNILTDLAVSLSNKVFCTSPSSYTAKFEKTILMPVGIDTNFFRSNPSLVRRPNSFLFLGRIAPVKKVVEFVEWLNERKITGIPFTATIVGSALPKDLQYYLKVQEKVREYGLEDSIEFQDAVTQQEALTLYQTHEAYVNLTPAGSMDKTILEAAACETRVIVANKDLKFLEDKDGKELREFVEEHHSINLLMEKLQRVIQHES